MPRNNVKYDDKEVFCQGCGASLGTGWKVQHRKFCSNKCQASYTSKCSKEQWLSTGVVPGYTGGKGGHTPRASYIREHIIEEQKGLCNICRLPPQWNKKPLTFILDHIDGDCTKNNRENLQLICPNCDSQLDTFKAKNKGKGRGVRGFMLPHNYSADS